VISPTTISGTLANIYRDTHVSVIMDEGIHTFFVAQNAVIMIDNTQSAVPFLLEGMMVNALVDAQRQIVSLVARTVEREISGTITDILNENLSIEDSSGRVHELHTTPETQILRNGEPVLAAHELRIGDTITAETDRNRITSLRATGELSTAQGRLTEIRITERIAQITISSADSSVQTYFIRPHEFDVYSLRINSFLTIQLDSREVLNIF
jgi:hypothetical protein